MALGPILIGSGNLPALIRRYIVERDRPHICSTSTLRSIVFCISITLLYWTTPYFLSNFWTVKDFREDL